MLVFVCGVNIMYVRGENQFCVKRGTCPVSLVLLSRRSFFTNCLCLVIPGLCMINLKPSELIYCMCVCEGILCVCALVCTIT